MKKSIILAAAALMMGSQVLFAVQAKRGVERIHTQADGSTLTVTVTGDERSHCYLTADGLPLMEDGKGNLYYATLDASGKPMRSEFLASDIARRPASVNAFLRNVDKDLLRRDILAERAASSAIAIRTDRTLRSGMNKANKSTGVGLYDDIFPHSGTVHSLVIIVEYPDSKFTVENPNDFFTRMLNEEGFSDYGATGSARDYFVENSMNQFRPTFDVYGPVTLPEKVEYYGGNDWFGEDKAPEQMVVHACQALDDELDFSLYDLDKDGKVDNIFIIYAGKGEASYGSSETVWPHQWDLSLAGVDTKTRTFDGTLVDHYACTNEWEDRRPDGIGTFVHEFSHVMGLPDLYTTDYGSASSLTPGEWSVLDYGPYNNDGRTPPAYSIYERNAMGWIDPIVLDGEAHVSLGHILATNDGAIKTTDNKNEFFLFENRQQEGWDKYIPGHGMLIWHIDYNQAIWATADVNNRASHQYVDIEEASGKANNDNFEHMAGYAFPGTSNNTSFTDDTTPNMLTWNKTRLDTPITGITEENGIISFDVCGGVYELVAPIVTVAAVTPEGFTLSWETVQGANQYEVQVFDSPTLPEAIQSITTSNTSCKVGSLSPETEYYIVAYALRNSKRSDASQVVAATTAAFDFTYFTPEAFEATEVGEHSFTAHWNEVEGAVDYLLTVSVESSSTDNLLVPFGSGSSLNIPSGWDTNLSNSDKYTSSGYCGQAVPSLKFTSSGKYLETKIFDLPVSAVSFWARKALGSNQDSSDSYLTVYGRANEDAEWTTLALCRDITADSPGETIVLDEIPEGIFQLRFEYTKVTGNLALDDVSITLGYNGYEPIEGYDHTSVGSTATSTVVYINPDVNQARSEDDQTVSYSYTVQAVDELGRTSHESNRISVEMLVSGITDVNAANEGSATYFNLQGVEIAEPTAPGIYLRRVGSTTTKVVR